MSEHHFPVNKELRPKKKFAVGISLVLLATLIFSVFQYSVRSQPFDKVLELTSREMNRNCPMMQDADTKLENTEILPDRVLQYNYTLIDVLRDSIDVEMLYTGFLTAMTENARNNPDLELFRKNKVTFSYSFKDRAGVFVTRIKITPEHYR